MDIPKIERVHSHEGISCLTQRDIGFPRLLKEIHDPPICLFVRGEMPPADFCVSVVGTRKNSPYGAQITREITAGLARAGVTVVSGLALGIDGIAHEATLENGGTTIAVLGGGVDTYHISPASHSGLAQRIAKSGGAVISEYPPGAVPNAFTFPKRNRIIAGMSLGVLVTEAGEESGALITAKCALDYNREVFAVPHPITTMGGIGPNNLIKLGAHLVSTSEDILEVLNLENVKTFVENKKILPATPLEETLLAALSREPTHIDALAKRAGLDSRQATSTLTLLEMKGAVRNLGAMMYVLAN